VAIRQGGLERKSKASQEIPSSSLADIAFLLLIFFMVTTVFRTDSERDIDWPQAEATQKIDEKKKNILNIWVERNGSVYINDQPYSMDQVSEVVRPLYSDSDRALVVSIRGDREVPYRIIDQMQQELVSAGVVRVVFATDLEQRLTTQRR
jgi:biopolymer transport protein ExbD